MLPEADQRYISRTATHLRKHGKRLAWSKQEMQHLDGAMGGAHERTPLMGHGASHHDSAFMRHLMYTLDTAKKTLFSNPVNVLLVFVPVGIVAGAMGWNPTVVFILNFLAIMPLASLLSFATEELAAKLGQTIGGLLNATFGNAVELIVGALLLRV